jgi:dTMP kinase
MSRQAGRFVVLDGPDGCGKSTQVRLLTEWLRGRGITVTAYRDPGTTAVGERIRSILLDSAELNMPANVEALLFMAARAQLWHEHIAADLEGGTWVVMDRWVSSTCAYQGFAGGFGIEKVIALGQDCLSRIWPDLTIVLDVDTETATGRMDRALDRMEQKGRQYHAKVREGFLELARMQPEHVRVVDATRSIDEVQREVQEIVGMLTIEY